MIDFNLFPRDRWCWGYAWAWLLSEEVDGTVEITVRGLAQRARWKRNEAERFLRRIEDDGLAEIEIVGAGRRKGTVLHIRSFPGDIS